MHGFVDELRQTVLNADARLDIFGQQGTALADHLHRDQHLVDGFKLLAVIGFLAQTDKGGTQQTLEFRVRLFAQNIADLFDCRRHQAAAQAGVQVCQLTHTDGCFAPVLLIFSTQATKIIAKNLVDGFFVSPLHQLFQELTDVAGRNAGRLVGR